MNLVLKSLKIGVVHFMGGAPLEFMEFMSNLEITYVEEYYMLC